jgi:hypothetical protein
MISLCAFSVLTAAARILGTAKNTRCYAAEIRAWIKVEASDSLGRSFGMQLMKCAPGAP